MYGVVTAKRASITKSYENLDQHVVHVRSLSSSNHATSHDDSSSRSMVVVVRFVMPRFTFCRLYLDAHHAIQNRDIFVGHATDRTRRTGSKYTTVTSTGG